MGEPTKNDMSALANKSISFPLNSLALCQVQILMRCMIAVKSRYFCSCFVKITVFIGFFAILNFSDVRAQSLPYPDSLDWGVSSLALGGAHTASTYNSDAFLGNPAGLVFFENKSSIGGGWLNLPRSQNSWNLSIIDGTRGVIGGFHFNWANVAGSNRQSYTLGAAYKTKYGSIGQTIQIYRFSGLTGPGDGWYLTHSTGILVPVSMGIALAMHAKSYIDQHDNSKIPPSVHMGVVYSKNQFRASFQTDRRFGISNQDWNYSFGGDLIFMKYFGARAGYRWDNSTNFSYYSFGASFVGPKIEVGSFFLRTLDGRTTNGYGFDTTLRF